ncbi:MAG: TIGR00730 family Rossman fold protein [Oligoflexia bacterium]|nr:TIGR00730 family Rossman fold protein [Oligoflexia bacterium]
MKRICVFCGSNPGNRLEYLTAAKELGHLLAAKKIGLVYGGASIGIMGAIANAVLEKGGEVIGVMPQHLVDREVAHKNLTTLHVVKTMHERKALMEKLSDAFIALPGGFGTLDEFCEILTWSQLGFHKKPSGLLNIVGYYDLFIKFINNCNAEGLIRKENHEMMFAASNAKDLLKIFDDYIAATNNLEPKSRFMES